MLGFILCCYYDWKSWHLCLIYLECWGLNDLSGAFVNACVWWLGKRGIAVLSRTAPINHTASTIHFQVTDHYSADGRQMVINLYRYRSWTICGGSQMHKLLCHFFLHDVMEGSESGQKLHPPAPTEINLGCVALELNRCLFRYRKICSLLKTMTDV